ncbi:MAG: exodeoxyribonuclease VII small subunit [Oscillospiraceae bacterium]|jgi:exodeoxyribonuclease VII small subunit
MTKQTKINLTFEQAMTRLEAIVAELDGGSLSLDASLALFSEGAELVHFCNQSLEEAKLRMDELFPERERMD